MVLLFPLIAFVLLPERPLAQGVPIDTSGVRSGAVTVAATGTAVSVAWPDETARTWTATFSPDPRRPLITSIAAGGAGDRPVSPR
jgi:hypothetical protein